MPWRLPSISVWSARISVLYFSTPAGSVHLRVRSEPSTEPCEPLRRYWPAISARRPLNTTRCHSVASFISPDCLSFQRSVVAMVTLATWSPLGKVRISGSRPRLPTMMALLTDALAQFSVSGRDYGVTGRGDTPWRAHGPGHQQPHGAGQGADQEQAMQAHGPGQQPPQGATGKQTQGLQSVVNAQRRAAQARWRQARGQAGLAGLQHIEAAEEDEQQAAQGEQAGLVIDHRPQAQLHQADQHDGGQEHRAQMPRRS